MRPSALPVRQALPCPFLPSQLRMCIIIAGAPACRSIQPEGISQACPFSAYSAAVAAIGLAFLVRVALSFIAGPDFPEYLVFYPTVMIVALLAGCGRRCLPACVSAVFVAVWILPEPRPVRLHSGRRTTSGSSFSSSSALSSPWWPSCTAAAGRRRRRTTRSRRCGRARRRSASRRSS